MKAFKGLTLIELMVVVTLFVFLLGIVLGLLTFGNVSWQSGSSKMTLVQELRRGMESMVRELSQAKASTISLSAGGTSSSISFQTVRDLNGDGAISYSSGILEGLDTPDPYIAYSLSYNAALGSNQLIRTTGGASSVLANYLVDIDAGHPALRFNRTASSTNIIEITLSGEKKSTFGHILRGSLNGRVILRN